MLIKNTVMMASNCGKLFNIGLFFLITIRNVRCQAPISGSEANMCKYNQTKSSTVLRKNITTTTEYHTKNCGLPLQPQLQCPETKVFSRIYWYPVKKTESFEIIKCCPGWSNYVKNVGCTQRAKCAIVLPQNDNPMCKMIRLKYKMYNRMHYKLTTPIKPNDPNRTDADVIFPSLNQTAKDVLTRAMMDPFTSHWFNVYFYGMLKRTNETQAIAHQKFKHLKFDTIEDFITIYNFFIPQQEKVPLPYFKLPSMQPGFRNIVYNETWALDKSFVEQRLAGLNPMALQKVTRNGDVGIAFGKLMESLNKTFDWNTALRNAVGGEETLESAMEKGKLFAVDYPIYHDIPHVPDIMDEDPTDKRTLLRSTSPIGIFAVGKDEKGANELKIVAIQMDYKPASEVRTPRDGSKWMIAKGFLQIADYAVAEVYEHLLRTHVRIEPICVCIHRHLAPTHPLYQFLRMHCRGLIPTNIYGLPRLKDEHMYMHRMFAMGHVGTVAILNNGYLNMKWKDNDLFVNIKARGVDDPEILPYYPYRDDGKVIYEVVKSFSKDLIDLYYKTDDDVVMDEEIQSLVNELSADGKGSPDSGKGKIAGFPANLTSKADLTDVMQQIIWLIVQHAAVNYPITGYGSFTPAMPTKLYADPEHKDYGTYLNMLPKRHVAILQTLITINLGSMRYDKLFDYSKDIDDNRGKLLVSRYFEQLNNEIQPMLEQRNKVRYAEGHLTYPYLEPKWLTNSIHT